MRSCPHWSLHTCYSPLSLNHMAMKSSLYWESTACRKERWRYTHSCRALLLASTAVPSTPSCITPFSRELPGTPHDCKLLSKQACTNLQLLFYQTYRAPSYRRCLLCNMDPVLDQIESKTLIVKKKMKKNPNATEKKIVRKTVKQTSIWGLYILGRKKKSKADTWLKRQSFLPLTPKWFQE